MPHEKPVLTISCGPFTVYLTAYDRVVPLGRIAQDLPSATPVVWLDSARTHPVTGRWSLLGYDPWLTLISRGSRSEVRTSHDTRIVTDSPLHVLRQIVRRYQVRPHAHPAMRALGLLGFLSYELNRWIERLPEPQPGEQATPEMLWFGMRRLLLVDHLQQETWILSVMDPHRPTSLARREALKAFGELQAQVDTAMQEGLRPSQYQTARDSAECVMESTTSQAEFETMVGQALEFIRAGDIFQANVAQRFTTSWRRPSFPLYQALRQVNPSPFACWLSWEDLAVVSCSPERLVRVRDGRVETRPIAGTRPRGRTPQDDAIKSLELLMSEKERAEHIMLVDLERNDIGRLARPGSVTVDELMTLEEYSHVIHIVSNIVGTMRRGVDAVDVIRAMFPGGTITGCPKVRCMQILRELEPVARGLYTGSLGAIGFDGTIDLNIAIRTMVVQGDRLSFHVGAGIVADSHPEREYHETLAKAGALMDAIQMVNPDRERHDARVR